jgi:CRP-like cAMP-binding protein
MSKGDAEADLAGITRSELAYLLRAGQLRVLPAFTLLCGEGQPAPLCYVVAEGTVEVTRTLPSGKHVMSTHGPGSILALLAAFDGGPCRVSMRAVEEVKVLAITRDGLLAIFGVEDTGHAALADRLTIAAIHHLRRAIDDLAQVIHRSLTAPARPGRLEVPDLALIHAGNHAWKV